MSAPLATLLESKKVIVCVGAGGVGKTTVSAALGVAAARRGKRALVLTVDPARRLANALGLQSFREDIQTITRQAFAAEGCPVEVGLDAAMLDVKSTFDRVVGRYAKDPQTKQRILEHPFYRQASTALAGAQEYMAVERLVECVDSGQYDVIVLDTPPAEHAIEFLDAPSRLVDLFDSSTFRLLLRSGSGVRAGIFRTGSVVVRGLSRFTSVEMFRELLDFFVALSETFDGFVERARAAQALLASEQAGFVVVAACDEVSMAQAVMLREELARRSLAVSAMVANRLSPFPTSPAQAGPELESGLLGLLSQLGPEAMGGDVRDARRTAGRMAEVARHLARLAQADTQQVEQARIRLGPGVPLVAVRRAASEPDSLVGLTEMAQVLESSESFPRPGA